MTRRRKKNNTHRSQGRREGRFGTEKLVGDGLGNVDRKLWVKL